MAPRKDNNNNNNNSNNNISTSIGGSATAAAPATAVTSAAEFMSSQDNAAAEQRQALYLANAKLCRLVKRCPWMYDRQHPNYAKKHIVDKSWTKIAKDCGDDSVASCKERWRNIRAAFARSINIYKTTCGPNRVKPYYLYNDLRFLIKPMMDAREMMNKDTDDIKSDWDDSAMAALPSSTQASTKKVEQDSSTASVSPVTEKASPLAEPLSDVEADLNFNDEEFELAAKAAETEAELMDVMYETDNEETFSFPENVTTTHNNNNNNNNNKRTVVPVERFLDTHTPKTQKPSKSTQDFSHGYFYHAAPNDADAKFLEALLPDMRAMNTRQKIIFKRKIYQSLEEVFETNVDFPVRNSKAATAATAGSPRYPSATRADASTRCNGCSNSTHGITNLKDREITQLQNFVQNMLVKGATAAAPAATATGNNRERKTTDRSRAGNQNQSRNRTQSRGRGALQTANSNVSQVTAAEAPAATVNCNGSDWQQLQPISVKTELIDNDIDDNGNDEGEDDDDINDFE